MYLATQRSGTSVRLASAFEASEDPDWADKEDVQAQFVRIDTSKNGAFGVVGKLAHKTP